MTRPDPITNPRPPIRQDALAAFVAQKWDEPRLRQLYLGVAGTADTARQNDAIRATLGIGRDALVTEWRRWLVDQVR